MERQRLENLFKNFVNHDPLPGHIWQGRDGHYYLVTERKDERNYIVVPMLAVREYGDHRGETDFLLSAEPFVNGEFVVYPKLALEILRLDLVLCVDVGKMTAMKYAKAVYNDEVLSEPPVLTGLKGTKTPEIVKEFLGVPLLTENFYET